MNIGIGEAIITAPQVNSRNELIYRVRIKKEDWDESIKDAIYSLNDTGTPVSIAMVAFQEQKAEDPLPKLRQQLALVMQEYCEVSGNTEEDELKKIYNRHLVESRKELSEEMIISLIESYRAGIQQFNQ